MSFRSPSHLAIVQQASTALSTGTDEGTAHLQGAKTIYNMEFIAHRFSSVQSAIKSCARTSSSKAWPAVARARQEDVL